MNWLKKDLATDAAKNAEFRMIFMHHPVSDAYTKRYIPAVIEPGKVDLLLSGPHPQLRPCGIQRSVCRRWHHLPDPSGRAYLQQEGRLLLHHQHSRFRRSRCQELRRNGSRSGLKGSQRDAGSQGQAAAFVVGYLHHPEHSAVQRRSHRYRQGNEQRQRVWRRLLSRSWTTALPVTSTSSRTAS